MQVLPEKQQPWQQSNVILQLLGAAVGTAALARLLLAPFFPAKQQQQQRQQQAQAVEHLLQLPVQRTWQPQLLTVGWVWLQKLTIVDRGMHHSHNQWCRHDTMTVIQSSDSHAHHEILVSLPCFGILLYY
jgi:hypothetical protein